MKKILAITVKIYYLKWCTDGQLMYTQGRTQSGGHHEEK